MQTNLTQYEGKTPGDRTVMHVLYGLHTLAWFSGGVFAVIALIVNYLRRSDELDTLYLAHHNYMIATFWWTLLWLVLLSPLWLLFILPGAIAYGIIWLWYLYRCIKGWMRFNGDRLP
ncbi:hypothetical protein [Polaromonas sp.]|uniref:DUF4870 family protein n=1 Tax=Polaromonas sp. TaxID=1869339 RepID=UPI0017AF699D|nr:hypothetical protein [Polaromonas sp.]NML84156.1 hypothetical protein [Polaromonas sp.]